MHSRRTCWPGQAHGFSVAPSTAQISSRNQILHKVTRYLICTALNCRVGHWPWLLCTKSISSSSMVADWRSATWKAFTRTSSAFVGALPKPELSILCSSAWWQLFVFHCIPGHRQFYSFYTCYILHVLCQYALYITWYIYMYMQMKSGAHKNERYMPLHRHPMLIRTRYISGM